VLGLQYQQGKQQQKAQYEAQKRQNEIARKNALQRYASAQLKIRQETKQASAKGLEATLRARKARAAIYFISRRRWYCIIRFYKCFISRLLQNRR
jgi:hypothetical protein